MSEMVWLEGEEKPRGRCWCGCGTPTPVSGKTRALTHAVSGVPSRFAPNHHHFVPILVRFHRHFTPDENGCWVWTANVNRFGYGSISLTRPDGRKAATAAHRVAHELFIGPIPEGHEVDHLCRVTSCVNPDHLEAVTPEENRRRRHEANRVGVYAETCGRGHLWSENEYVIPATGQRNCRACRTVTRRARIQRGVAA